MTTQPEALRLADVLDADLCEFPLQEVSAELRRQHARIAELESQLMCNCEWQNIETAPKDGSEILICKAVNADGEPMGKSFGLFVHRAAWWGEEGWIVYNSLICENQAFFEPTHWMHIPPAPSTEGESNV